MCPTLQRLKCKKNHYAIFFLYLDYLNFRSRARLPVVQFGKGARLVPFLGSRGTKTGLTRAVEIEPGSSRGFFSEMIYFVFPFYNISLNIEKLKPRYYVIYLARR